MVRVMSWSLEGFGFERLDRRGLVGLDLGSKRIGYEWISLISYLFSYLCPDSDSNTDSIKNDG
jgi:hypothetical protein